jgi:hypothetical protein
MALRPQQKGARVGNFFGGRTRTGDVEERRVGPQERQQRPRRDLHGLPVVRLAVLDEGVQAGGHERADRRWEAKHAR